MIFASIFRHVGYLTRGNVDAPHVDVMPWRMHFGFALDKCVFSVVAHLGFHVEETV